MEEDLKAIEFRFDQDWKLIGKVPRKRRHIEAPAFAECGVKGAIAKARLT